MTQILMMRKLHLLLLLMVAMGVQAQEKGMKMDLWPNGATYASTDKEDKAELTVYLPDAKKATGRAGVCCPGGTSGPHSSTIRASPSSC